MRDIFTFLICLTSISLFGQGITNNWIIGERMIITFINNQLNLSSQPNITRGVEVSAAISDSNAILLVYTDGVSIWGSNHQLIRNGNDLYSDRTSAQTPLVLQHESQKDKYYMINHDSNRGGVVSLNIIDLSEPEEFEVQLKNVVFDSLCDESLGVVPIEDGYWLITHDAIVTNVFKIYELRDDSAAFLMDLQMGSIPNKFNTILEISPDSKKWCFINRDNLVELYYFDICLQVWSDPISIELSTFSGKVWRPIFSPNSDLLYLLVSEFEEDNIIYQYQIDSPNKEDIESSKVEVGRLRGRGISSIGVLHSDDKIYLGRIGERYISSISKPNEIGNLCSFEDSILLTPFQLQTDFQKPILKNKNKLSISIEPNVLEFCPNDKVVLLAHNSAINAAWNTGESTDSITITNPGIYSISGLNELGCVISDTIEVLISEDCTDPNIPIADCSTYIPNAISLNSNRGNDGFAPISSCELIDYRLEVYDRWGGRVYESIDPLSTWQGIFNGELLQSGVYPYIMRYRYHPDQHIVLHSGTLTIFR